MGETKFYLIGHSVRDLFARSFRTLREAKREAQKDADRLGRFVTVSHVTARDYSETYLIVFTAKPKGK